METSTRKRKFDGSDGVVLFLAPQRINKVRLTKMRETAVKKGFRVAEKLSDEVTHIVTELPSRELVMKNLGIHKARALEMVNTSWFSESVKAGRPLDVLGGHRVRNEETTEAEKPREKEEVFTLRDYACQRSTPLKHHNEKFTSALEVIEQHAELRNDQSVNDHSRALAFRRAAAVLKSLPKTVTKISDVRGLKDIGKHAEAVIKDILEHGYSTEVQIISASEQFKTLKLFDGVFGIGPSTANSWYQQGHRTIQDVTESTDALRRNDKRVQYGLAFYKDLSAPVPRDEAERIESIVSAACSQISPGTSVTLTGGFRRGKATGHDVDLLITHPDHGNEKGLLTKLLASLQTRNLILHGRHENRAANSGASRPHPDNTMDDFEKWIGILKLPNKNNLRGCNWENGETLSDTSHVTDFVELARSGRPWTARRVDLVIAPIDLYYYALVGWTGSKQFNRSLRLYAQRELNMRLTSSGLYPMSQLDLRGIPAKSEREVFENLKLEYREPLERNC